MNPIQGGKMSKLMILTLLVILTVTIFGCSPGYEKEFRFDFTFEENEEGWITGFADLPADYNQESFELDAGWGELPSGLEGNAIYMQGHNRSDDLFMYLTKEIEGLKPDTRYQLVFTIELASNTPAGMVGIGGSPGESVFVKAGAVNYEPEAIEEADGHLRMDIDKGNQSSEGKDMINLGTISNPNINLETFTGEEYALMTLDNLDKTFSVTTNSDGSVWVIVGTDSGFEGLTKVYYDQIAIEFIEE